MRSFAVRTSARLPENVCGGNATGRPKVASYSVSVSTRNEGGAVRSNPSKSSNARARVSCRARSALKLKKNHRVIVPEQTDRLVFGIGDDTRLDELVGDATRVGLFDQDPGVRTALADTAGHRLVGTARAVPPPVPVHRMVAPRTRSRPARPQLRRTCGRARRDTRHHRSAPCRARPSARARGPGAPRVARPAG